MAGGSMDGYEIACPTNQSKHEIHAAAERFASEVEFFPGDRIEPLVARLGGHIEYLDAASSLRVADGSLFVEGPRNFRILVSGLTGVERDRFTIAHELGHYVLHSELGKKRIQVAREGSDQLEWEANWFAAAFLMPSADFRATCDKYGGRSRLVAARYLVSPAAAAVRMKALGLPIVDGG